MPITEEEKQLIINATIKQLSELVFKNIDLFTEEEDKKKANKLCEEMSFLLELYKTNSITPEVFLGNAQYLFNDEINKNTVNEEILRNKMKVMDGPYTLKPDSLMLNKKYPEWKKATEKLLTLLTKSGKNPQEMDERKKKLEQAGIYAQLKTIQEKVSIFAKKTEDAGEFLKEKYKSGAEIPVEEQGKYLKAYNSSREFHKFMKELCEEYVNLDISEKDLILCVNTVFKAKPDTAENISNELKTKGIKPELADKVLLAKKDLIQLKTHRSWSEVLVNLLAAFLSLPLAGIPYAAAAVHSKVTTGRWTVFKQATDSGQKLDELKKAVDTFETSFKPK